MGSLTFSCNRVSSFPFTLDVALLWANRFRENTTDSVYTKSDLVICNFASIFKKKINVAFAVFASAPDYLPM